MSDSRSAEDVLASLPARADSQIGSSPDESTAEEPTAGTSRREFLQTSTRWALAGGAVASGLPMPMPVHAAGSDELRVGLIGCGGRGTGAAAQALQADAHVRLTALADVFADPIEKSLQNLRAAEEVADKVDVPAERQFVGFDAYRQLIDSGVDVVLLATPPQFRPLHLRAAIEAGKHVFAEKPVAVDSPGVRSVVETCRLAEERGLSVVSGLCLRYDGGFRQTVQRLHDGAIGDIHTLFANDYRGPIWVKPRQPGWTDMYWQMRNWYYFTWLSGDFNVEQHVHYLDVCAWVMQGYPVSALGLGGRQVRTGPEYGNIYDHHSVVYEYANGAQLVSNCRQQPGCHNLINSQMFGSRGRAEVSENRLAIEGEGGSWQFREKVKNMYEVEHDELFASIRQGKPINNGQYMALSTLLAIMGRMATYTGQRVTWDEALNSTEDLSPPRYDWDVALDVKIAIPGSGV
jgi:predicted dehydrogenase